ncbi:MAG: MmgE/PrpD family protein [Chloroflexi bacterium]|nr:MmgE/PrpD family protein [Chloroflexota bacterium]
MSDSRNLLEQIVDYAINLRYEDIPAEALELAKTIVFDSIGTGLGGYQRELGSKAVAYAESMMAGDEATLLGNGRRVSVEGAAFANGVMVKILGMDDSHRSAGHIASQLVPAVLAVGEAYQSTGREMIVAIVAAYDFAVRVGRLVRPMQRERGLDLKGTLGAITSALALARCARLDRETMINCVALAADLASGTEQYVYESGLCDTKDLIAGFAARNAVFALRLSDSGFYGPRGALDGEYGFFQAFGDGYEPDLFADLGHNFAILGTGFKPHGGCRHTHQAIDAVQAILQDGPLDISAIESIELGTYGYATRPIFRVDPNPPSREVAGLSIRVSTGVALQQGSAWPHDFAAWDDPEVRRLRNLIDVQVDNEIEADYPRLNGCRLRITLDTGEVRQAYLPNMKGEPEFRMSRDEMREKFAVLTRELFADGHVDEIYQRCMNLESYENIMQLLQFCAAGETVPV